MRAALDGFDIDALSFYLNFWRSTQFFKELQSRNDS